MKIYLAGPDIFRTDARTWCETARALCHAHGFEALTPFDHGETEPLKILQGNLALIRQADIVAANLNPFRGHEPDSGTAFEVGYAHAIGKQLWGYVDSTAPLLERIVQQDKLPAGCNRDLTGMEIEDFGLPVNLMLALTVNLVQGNLADCIEQLKNCA